MKIDKFELPEFRVWDGKKFHYTPDFNLHFVNGGITVALNDGGMVFSDGMNIHQYIHYDDVEKQKIFTGDIVEFGGYFDESDERAYVVQDGANISLCGKMKTWTPGMPFTIHPYDACDICVVGNICESAELLEW